MIFWINPGRTPAELAIRADANRIGRKPCRHRSDGPTAKIKSNKQDDSAQTGVT
jgi:hypothetical protein